jgi:hypothetical protein
MQEIITEILKKHGFPTKNVEELVASLKKWDSPDSSDFISLVVITNGNEIVGYSLESLIFRLFEHKPTWGRDWRYCSLGSELVARLKGGEG